tara:strand:- start:214 stop:540 length:327 start_codon:yes stop_codon:yes gene_type:complete
MTSKPRYLIYAIVFLTLLSQVRGEDDDDDILGELITDIMVGAAVAACETSAGCNGLLTIISFISVLFVLTTCICGSDRDRDELWESMPSKKRIAGTGAGYVIGTRLFR